MHIHQFLVKTSVRLFLLILLNILVLIAFLFSLSSYNRNKENLLEEYRQELKYQTSIILQVYQDMAESIFYLNIQKDEITSIIYRGISGHSEEAKNLARTQLYEKLSPLYSIIKKYNFRQLHFHESNNHSFIRFHRPEKYGDDLTGFRYSVEYVNKYGKPMSGFEEGRIYNGYRFVFPLSYGDIQIGSVEISVSMKTLVEQLHRNYGKQVQFILSRKVVEETVFLEEQPNYILWDMDNRYVLDRAISDICMLDNYDLETVGTLIQNSLSANNQKRTSFSVILDREEKNAIITFIPVLNFKGEAVGWLFSLDKYDKLAENKHRFFYFTVLFCFLFFLVTFFIIYYITTQKKIEDMAMYDVLTHAYSRGVFFRFLEHEDYRFKRYKQPYSIIMLDIDYFKRVNDTWGHQVGDYVLKELARLVFENIRKSDIFGRYGGEEFLIVLPLTSLKEAVDVAEKLRTAVETFSFKEIDHLTISCGVSERKPSMDHIDYLIKDVDSKLYQAKEKGRNQSVY